MGEFIITTLQQAPFHALAVVSIVIAGGLLSFFKDRLQKDFENFEKQMEVWTKSMGQHMRETRTSLDTHKEAMGKATKAINGDMLSIKENIFSLKTEVVSSVENLKVWTAKLERGVEKNAHQVEMVTQKFDEKIASVVRVQEQINELFGKVTVLGEQTDNNTKTTKQVIEVLQNHKRQINKLKGIGDDV